jgi:pimeloyl-ACP methyl ester carboxylesterase
MTRASISVSLGIQGLAIGAPAHGHRALRQMPAGRTPENTRSAQKRSTFRVTHERRHTHARCVQCTCSAVAIAFGMAFLSVPFKGFNSTFRSCHESRCESVSPRPGLGAETRRVRKPSVHLGGLRATTTLPTSALKRLTPVAGRNKVVDIEGFSIYYDFQLGTVRPFVFFLPGLAKSRMHSKASELEVFCRQTGQGMFCADYAGTGRSSGVFTEIGTLSLWTSHAEALLEKVLGACGRVLLVGEGIGGWIALLLAMRRPERISGIIGLAADPDFTEDLVWPRMTPEQQRQVVEKGSIMWKHGFEEYPISRALVEDARSHLLLRGEPGSLPIDVPVRLIHGLNDEEVPAERSILLAQLLRSRDVTVTLVKHGDHALERQEDFRRLNDTITELCSAYFEFDLRTPQSG